MQDTQCKEHAGSFEYREAWKRENGMVDEHGVFSDEAADWWLEQQRQHRAHLQAHMPQTDRQWKRLFGLLNVFERRQIDKDDVKQRVDMRKLIQTYGVPLPHSESMRVFKCPFHEDRSPSFSVDFNRKLWNCHAGCGGGDCFSFVQRAEDCTFAEALHILNEMF